MSVLCTCAHTHRHNDGVGAKTVVKQKAMVQADSLITPLHRTMWLCVCAGFICMFIADTNLSAFANFTLSLSLSLTYSKEKEAATVLFLSSAQPYPMTTNSHLDYLNIWNFTPMSPASLFTHSSTYTLSSFLRSKNLIKNLISPILLISVYVHLHSKPRHTFISTGVHTLYTPIHTVLCMCVHPGQPAHNVGANCTDNVCEWYHKDIFVVFFMKVLIRIWKATSWLVSIMKGNQNHKP